MVQKGPIAQQRARSLFRPWEKEILLALGPRIDFEELVLLLPSRSRTAIYKLAEALEVTLFEDP